MNPIFKYNVATTPTFYPSGGTTINLAMSTNITDSTASYTLATFSAKNPTDIKIIANNPVSDKEFAFDGV